MGAKKRRPKRHIVSRHLPVVGSAPGVLNDSGEVQPPVIRITQYTAGDVIEHPSATVEEVAKAVSQDGVVWIDVVGVQNPVWLQRLGDTLGIHSLAVEDVANVPQRPKADEYENGIFLVLKLPAADHSLEQVSLFVGERFVATFQEHEGDCFEGIRKRARNPKSRLRSHGADYLGYAIVDAVVDSFFPRLEQLGLELDGLEERLADATQPTAAREIQAVRREVFRLRRELDPLREAIRDFLKEDVEILNDQTRPFLRDCEDHASQLLDDLDTCAEMSSALMDLHLSNSSQKLNEVMKFLTIISTIFIPLSFVAGLYGMNFDSSVSDLNMPELRWAFGYPAVLLVMLVSAGGLLLYFSRQGWIGQRRGRRKSDERARTPPRGS